MMIDIKYVCMTWMVLFNVIHCELVVKIDDGTLKGQASRSRDGRTFYSYTNIPFAKPPVGDLRFKAPQPVEPWNGTLDATKETIVCLQENKVSSSQEDCLYLDVHIPKTDKKLLPVMFWIFAGRFTIGDKGSGEYGPEYFMDKDVVFVSINYRVGALGFLSTEDDVIPGNNGMKDQVMALRWVQKNIVHFNGDPNQVTIFGASSGGTSVGFHLLSPMSKGLFHKAILQGGSPMCMKNISPKGLARSRAQALALIAGSNFRNSEDILTYLRRVPADQIIELQLKLYAWTTHPSVLFNIVVENCHSDEESFLCRNPLYDFKQESFVPTVIGFNSAEGGVYVAPIYNKTSLERIEFKTDFNRLFSIMQFYNHYTKQEYINEIGEKALKEYYPSGELDIYDYSSAVQMIGDASFTYCITDMAKNLSSPVYMYIYDYQNEFSRNEGFGLSEIPLGVTHGDERTSLFKVYNANITELNESDLAVSKTMVDIWYKFAATESPTTDGTENGNVWLKYDSENLFALHINSSNPNVVKNPFEQKYNFWSQLLNHRYFIDQDAGGPIFGIGCA